MSWGILAALFIIIAPVVTEIFGVLGHMKEKDTMVTPSTTDCIVMETGINAAKAYHNEAFSVQKQDRRGGGTKNDAHVHAVHSKDMNECVASEASSRADMETTPVKEALAIIQNERLKRKQAFSDQDDSEGEEDPNEPYFP